MTKEEILKDDWVANNYGDRGRNWVNLAFLDGVNWMEEKMQETNEGQALLYAVEKTTERTKKETLLEVLNWIEGRYDTDYIASDIVRMLKNKLKKNRKMQRITEYLKERNIPEDSLEANSILEGYELGADRTKREVIEKAVEWFEKYLFDIGYPDDWCRDSPNLISGKDRFIKAMQDERDF